MQRKQIFIHQFKYLFAIFGISLSLIFGSCATEQNQPEFTYSPIKLKNDNEYTKGELFRINTDIMEEASGIAASHTYSGYYYVHNDSGNPEEIYLIDSIGNFKTSIILKGIKNRDWEDICTGPGPVPGKSYIYVADIGDNQYTHKKYKIYRFEEPDIKSQISSDGKITIDNIQKFSFQYPEAVSFNAEACMIDPATTTFYVITKSKFASVFSVALAEKPDGIITAGHIIDLPMTNITGADISSGGDILMKDYSRIFLWKNHDSLKTESLLKTIPTESTYTIEPQGEGICWSADNDSYYTISEVRKHSTQYLIKYKKGQ